MKSKHEGGELIIEPRVTLSHGLRVFPAKQGQMLWSGGAACSAR